MKTKDLLSQLSRLERSLEDFSYEELSSNEASSLKKSFQAFKINLEEKVFQPTSSLRADTNFDSEKECPANPNSNQANKSVNPIMLVAKVSHEIRTPLNGIIGFTDLLKEDKLTKKQLERVDAIQTASYSLMDIINELLDYSKLASGLEHFERVDFNFKAIVNDVMYLCNTLVTNKNIKLGASIDPSIPKIIVGDPSKLSQVLLNLLGNAIKFVENGSIQLSIEQKSSKGTLHFLEFTIADTGIGISEAHLEHIFDSFKQAEHNTFAKYGGSGLGLSIVKQIIESLDGSIAVTSKLGEGTTFKFVIPFAKGNVNNMAVKKIDDSGLEKKKCAVKDLSVLVFEDNLLNQKLIEQQLKTWGCIPHITDNAHYGLTILENKKIDIVLMDLKMPGMSGFEVTDIIRKNKKDKVNQIPIVAISADFTKKDKEQCTENGINDFILKPYRTGELLSILVKNIKPMKTTLSIASNTIKQTPQKNNKSAEIDFTTILEDCLGEFILLEELVVLFKQNALEFIGAVRLHLSNNDLEAVAFAVHKIKSGLAMLKSEDLLAIVEQIQNTCKTDGDIKHLEFLYTCFLQDYPAVEEHIDQKMKELKKNL